MALALPASAHTQTLTTTCSKDGTAVLHISLSQYTPGKKHGAQNTVSATANGTSILSTKPFKGSDEETLPVDGSAPNDFVVTVFAQDDPDGTLHGNGAKDGQWDGTFTAHSDVCPQPTKPTPPPSSSNTPPPPPSSNTPPPSTTSVAPAAAATTPAGPPGSGELASTGVNAGLPLGIAGALVIIGGGLLFWLRFNARRRTS